MPLYRFDPAPIPEIDDDDSSAPTVNTPPESVATDLMDDDKLFAGADLIADQAPVGAAEPVPHLVPWPESTFKIRSVPSGHFITLLDGQIQLLSPGSRGSIHWECVESKGWLGFKNAVSGKLLGHGPEGRLRCSAERHQGWEHFCVRMRPEGGCVLLMRHYERLWHVGTMVEGNVKKLAKIGDGMSGGMAWEFVPV